MTGISAARDRGKGEVIEVSLQPVIDFLLCEVPELFTPEACRYPQQRADYLAGKILRDGVGISPRGHSKPGGGLIDLAYVIRDALWRGHQDNDGFDLNAAEEKALLLARKLKDVLTGLAGG